MISRFGKVTALVLLSMILTASACAKSAPPASAPEPAAPPKATYADFELNIPSELPPAMVGQPYSYDLADPRNIKGGKAPYQVDGYYSFKNQDSSELGLDDAGLSFDRATGILSGTPKPGSEGVFKGTVEVVDTDYNRASKDVTLYIMSDIVTVKGAGKVTATIQWGHLASVNKEAYQQYGNRLPEMAEQNPYQLLYREEPIPLYGVRAEVGNRGMERSTARSNKERLVVPHMVGALDKWGLPTLLPKYVAQITARASLTGVEQTTDIFPNQYLGGAQARAMITQDGKSLHFEMAGSGDAGRALYFGGETGDNDGYFETWVKTPFILKLTNTGTMEQSIDVTFQLCVDRTQPERKASVAGGIDIKSVDEYDGRLGAATVRKSGRGEDTQLAFGNTAVGGGLVPLQIYTKEVKRQFVVPPGSHVLNIGSLSAGGNKSALGTETGIGAGSFSLSGSIIILATMSATGEPVAFETPN